PLIPGEGRTIPPGGRASVARDAIPGEPPRAYLSPPGGVDESTAARLPKARHRVLRSPFRAMNTMGPSHPGVKTPGYVPRALRAKAEPEIPVRRAHECSQGCNPW